MLSHTLKNILHSTRFSELICEALACNEFFTLRSVQTAVRAIETQFLGNDNSIKIEPSDLKVGIICAGNIPLVGFADMYYALVSGSEVYIKPSTKDPLMRVFAPLCHIVESLPADMDIILAMGSTKTMQSIEATYTHSELVLRGEMHSVAVLDGKESTRNLEGLADDIFTHSSLGCRSVSHLFLPRHYDLSKLTFAPREELPQVWHNNYKQQRALITMRGEEFIDGGYYILKEGHQSTIGVLGYTFYDSAHQIDLPAQTTQCVVCNPWFAHERRVDFSKAQFPSRGEFANGIDILSVIRNHKKKPYICTK